MNYWLMKSEPTTYSIDDLKKDRTTSWDGVRNYQARNFMRDQMKIGDLVLFYHSNANPPGIVGVAKVCKKAHPDFTALDPKSHYFDPKASKDNPRWMMVDIEFVKKFHQIIPLAHLRKDPRLSQMILLRPRMRLSVQPLTSKEFETINSYD